MKAHALGYSHVCPPPQGGRSDDHGGGPEAASLLLQQSYLPVHHHPLHRPLLHLGPPPSVRNAAARPLPDVHRLQQGGKMQAELCLEYPARVGGTAAGRGHWQDKFQQQLDFYVQLLVFVQVFGVNSFHVQSFLFPDVGAVLQTALCLHLHCPLADHMGLSLPRLCTALRSASYPSQTPLLCDESFDGPRKTSTQVLAN